MTNYNAGSIQVIEGLAHVRKRPAMYIGDTETKGLHHLIWEIVDNSIDEATNGHADKIRVILGEKGNITVSDNGRGIPIDIHPDKKIPAARLVFEVLGAGGKFDESNYKTHGGLHGVGASVVNALCSQFSVEIYKDGHLYSIKYKDSILVEDLKEIGTTSEHGTVISFTPDVDIFTDAVFNSETIEHRLRELAFLNKDVAINFIDKVKETDETYCYSGGILEYLNYLTEGKETIGSPIYIEGEKDNSEVEVAFQYTTEYSDNIFSFANNIATVDGGKHDEGFRTALTRALNETIKIQNSEKKRGKKEISIQGSDAVEGLVCIISIRTANPKFEGQTKTKLSNADLKGVVTSVVYDGLMTQLSKNSKLAKEITEKVSVSCAFRESTKAARELDKKKNKLNTGAIFSIGKLADCSSKKADEREIFIVEGDSAGGSAKLGRNQKFQAILPLRGKPLNVEKKSLIDILNNDELKSVIQSIGTGFGKDLNMDNLKCHKVIIATDADVDGLHIQLILLTFFYRYMKPLIEGGYIYIAQPPLYKVFTEKKIEYAYSDKELDKAKKKVGTSATVQRYKGLGEMDASQLWETTMNPENRTLLRVTIDDATLADRHISILMGTKTEPRKDYILEKM